MTHNKVHSYFQSLFSNSIVKEVKAWFPNGKNSIRIRDFEHNEFVFTYNSPKDWKFETVDSFMRNM